MLNLLTVALSKFRHVANIYFGEVGHLISALIKPNPRPRLQPVIKIEFITSGTF